MQVSSVIGNSQLRCFFFVLSQRQPHYDNDILQICKKDYAVDFFLERKSHPYDKLPERRERQTDEDNRECNDDDEEEEEEEECL